MNKLSFNKNNNNCDKFHSNSVTHIIERKISVIYIIVFVNFQIKLKEKYGFADGSNVKRVSFARYYAKYDKRRSSTQSDKPSNQVFDTITNGNHKKLSGSYNPKKQNFRLIKKLGNSEDKNYKNPLKNLMFNIMQQCLIIRNRKENGQNQLLIAFHEFSKYIRFYCHIFSFK